MRIKRLILLNQMAGPLFREVAEGLSEYFPDGCILVTGHPDTLKEKINIPRALNILPAPAYDRSSLFKRLLSWFKYLLFASGLIVKSQKTDGFFIVSNPPIMGIWFWLLRRMFRRHYVILIYDIYPDVLIMMGKLKMNNPIVVIWTWLNKRVHKNAHAIITIGNKMAERIGRQIPSKVALPRVIPPWADIDRIRPILLKDNPLKNELNPEGKHVILYSGNMGISHDIESMLEAAKILNHRDDILFLFIGAGDRWQFACDFSRKENISNVKVYPFQAEDRLPYTMALSTISLVALDEGAEGLMLPSKVFYYMAAGSAIIGLCRGENDLRDVIESNKCGICINPREPATLAAEIIKILDDSKRLEFFRNRARRAADERYSRKAGVRQFISVFGEIGFIPRTKIL